MIDETAALRLQLARQIAHWRAAALALEEPENFASAAAWAALERSLGLALRRELRELTGRLSGEARLMHDDLARARSSEDLERLRRRLVAFRRAYLRTETLLDFYGDAVNTRTSPRLAALLAACDALAVASMQRALAPLGKPTPRVLSSVNDGLGARIRLAGLRLWDGGSPSAVAAIVIARHGLVPGTALFHEVGHEVGYLTGWNQELAAVLRNELEPRPSETSRIWASWAREIAADAYAFVIAGYGSVAALHDVLAGEESAVFRHTPGDPHPIAYLRVLLCAGMCTRFYGTGPWDDLVAAWVRAHPLDQAPAATRGLIVRSVGLLARVVELTLTRPMRAFDGRALATLIDPQRVRPQALDALERDAGAALYSSPHWLREEALRLLALCSLRTATAPERSVEIAALQEQWMTRLGASAAVSAEAA